MPLLTGGQAVARMFRDYGIRYMFGVPGGQTYPIYLGIHELEPDIRHVLFRCERCAAMAADAYARITGKPAVCDGTVGPGATNLLSGVAEAFGASSPLIAVTSNIHTWMTGKNANQEADAFNALRPFTKASFHVSRTDKIPDILRMAFRVATSGRPGPVHLDFPADILEAQMDFGDSLYVESEYGEVPARRIAPDPSSIVVAAEAILKAERPVIYAGGGVVLSRAFDELRQLAELLAIPVATSIMGKGVLPEDHPLSIGASCTFYDPEPVFISRAPAFVREADLVIFVGHRTEQFSTADWRMPRPDVAVVHIDIDPQEIGRNYRVVAGVVGDAKLSLQALLETLRPSAPEGDWRDQPRIRSVKEAVNAWHAGVAPALNSDAVPVTPHRILQEINEFINKDGILVSDAGLASVWTPAFYNIRRAGRTFLAPRGLAGIGNGLPATIGAKLAAPDLQVIGYGGDGAFILSLHELAMMRQMNLNATYIVSNNQCYAYGRKIYENLGMPVISMDLGEFNYADIARAFGCFGVRVERPENIKGALEAARDSGLPAVVEVLTTVEFPTRAAGIVVE